MLKKIFLKAKEEKRKKDEIFIRGYEKAEEDMNRRIKGILLKHSYAIKQKNLEIERHKKRIKKIKTENFKNLDVIFRMKSLMQKIQEDSYVKSMVQLENQKRIESYLHEFELSETKMSRNCDKMGEL